MSERSERLNQHRTTVVVGNPRAGSRTPAAATRLEIARPRLAHLTHERALS
ncbi:hypothetical protein [Nocardioides sp. B-3]|uniref:hypothetical protein n=1 Tax=Nocardioides sp. B-3 TaxID=2895565 RepID=UPI002152566E|nr:hypothetical protein [Nocardioides sp. B-3]UUZ60481.1 hypothetical protein LP418_06255 [Nocardioides sp. B-3]